MLLQVTTVDNNSLEQLFSVYEESMKDLQSRYASLEDMKASYADFLNEFLSIPNQYVLVEAAEGQWVSGLRAIETESGCWFLEAVETMPEERRKGRPGRRPSGRRRPWRCSSRCSWPCRAWNAER